VILFAAQKHYGQRDKSGVPYILHPIEVMCSVKTIEEKIVAICHDLIEDTDATLDDLRLLNVPEKLIEAIDHISKREDEKYSEFIERVSENDISIKVKVADIENNTRHDRIEKLDVVVVNRMMRKYERALDVLSDF
jgi:(p)ppGpp synthase/HD superfamily hydrolase